MTRQFADPPDATFVAAALPLTGRYAVQGAQARAGLGLWADRAGVRLLVEDDESRPERSAELYTRLLERECRFVLGPYGSDSARAVAATRAAVVWNHGAAADDVQRLPGVVSLPSPASRYLVALALGVAALRPGATVALASARGRFGRLARDGVLAAAPALGLGVVASFGLGDPPGSIAASGPDALLACGALEQELALFRAIRPLLPRTLLGGVSPGLGAFPALLGGSPEGMLAPVQWHPELGTAPELGPSSAEVAAKARSSGLGELDYVAAQIYAAALVAERCLDLSPDDPLRTARELRTTTFFGPFELDEAGLQIGHRLSVVRWREGRRELLLPDAA